VLKPFTELSVLIRKSDHSSVLQFKYVLFFDMHTHSFIQSFILSFSAELMAAYQINDKQFGRSSVCRMTAYRPAPVLILSFVSFELT